MIFKKKNKIKEEKNNITEDSVIIEEEKEFGLSKKEVLVSKVTNPLRGAKFWILIIAAAILLTVGLWIILDKTLGQMIAIGFTGAVLALFSVTRVIPLIKFRETSGARIISIIEIVIFLATGILLIYGAVVIKQGSNNGFTNFLTKYYRFFLGGAFYLKGLFYFINTVLFREKTTKFEFWLHIVFLTLGAIIFAISFDATNLAYLIAALCLASALVLGGDAGGNYYRYSKHNHSKKEKTKKKKDDKFPTDAPTIPLNDENKNENNYVC